MKTLKNIFASLILITFATVNVNAQESATDEATGDASATILKPITIIAGQTLNFGDIAPREAESVVDMSVTGTRVLDSGDAQLVPTDEGQNGTFTIAGQANAGFAITIPTAAITLTNSESSETMTVDNFVSSLGLSSILNASGAASLSIGAKLNVAADQSAGTYNGTYEVTVAYN